MISVLVINRVQQSGRGWGNWIATMILIDPVLQELSWNRPRNKYFVWKYYLSFGVSFALSIGDIFVNYFAFPDKMSSAAHIALD